MRYKNNSGAAMIIVVTISAVLFGMLALSADMGYLFLARNQLQNAADAGALAGVSELTYLYGGTTGSEQSARDKAIEYATKHLAADRLVEATDVAVDISSDASEFGVVGYTGPAIRVAVRRTGGTSVTLFFGRILGKPEAGVMATAVARLVPAGGICGIRPFAIRDKDLGAPDWVVGQTVTLKFSAQGESRLSPAWFSPVRFPPIASDTHPTTCVDPSPPGGADRYRDHIRDGSSCDCMFGIGDTFEIEPGNMPKPTVQAVTDLTNNFTKAVVVPILLFQFDDYISNPGGGDAKVKISRIGDFRIDNVLKTGPEMGNIIGSFAGISTTGGVPGSVPDDQALLFAVQLIR